MTLDQLNDHLRFQDLGTVLGLIFASKWQKNPRKWLRAAIRDQGMDVKRTLKRIRAYRISGDPYDLFDSGGTEVLLKRDRVKTPWLEGL